MLRFGVRSADYFLKQILESEFPEWDCVACRVPPSPRYVGIIELAGNVEKNLGAQSLADKILIPKNLGTGNQVAVPKRDEMLTLLKA